MAQRYGSASDAAADPGPATWSWWRVIWQVIVDFAYSDATITAGHLAFTGLLAIFPFVLFLVAVAGLVGQTEAAAEIIGIGIGLLPPEVRDAIVPALEQIRGGTTPGLLTVGILGALWAASSGIEGMRHALDAVYDHDGQRMSVVMMRLQSLLLTVVTALGALCVILLVIAAPFIRNTMEWLAERDLGLPEGFDLARYGLGLALLLGMCVMLHLLLPAARLRLREVLPGAVVSVAAWAGVAAAYSSYLRYLGSYNLTYGSLGGIVLTLFFFYISAAVFIFGAQLNGTLRRLRSSPAAEPPARPDRSPS
jgi:membrane protein